MKKLYGCKYIDDELAAELELPDVLGPPDPHRFPRLSPHAACEGDWFEIVAFLFGDWPGAVVRNQHTGDLYWHDPVLGSRATTSTIMEACDRLGSVTGVGIQLRVRQDHRDTKSFEAHPPRRSKRETES